ncbi:jupiter microtubule associated homolog 1b isoform 3-T5 [Salvelinus alpinus]
MSAPSLCCAIFLCLLCSTLAEKGNKGLLVRKQEGDTMTIHCSTSLPDQENLSVYMRLTKEIQVLYFHQATEKFILHERFKLRLMTNGRLNKMDITITNLTIEDSGAYWCVYSVYKKTKLEKTEGEGAVLLVVNGLGMSWYMVLVSAVTAGSVLLLSLLILFTWVIPRCFHSHSREVTVVQFDGQLINETHTCTG